MISREEDNFDIVKISSLDESVNQKKWRRILRRTNTNNAIIRIKETPIVGPDDVTYRIKCAYKGNIYGSGRMLLQELNIPKNPSFDESEYLLNLAEKPTLSPDFVLFIGHVDGTRRNLACVVKRKDLFHVKCIFFSYVHCIIDVDGNATVKRGTAWVGSRKINWKKASEIFQLHCDLQADF